MTEKNPPEAPRTVVNIITAQVIALSLLPLVEAAMKDDSPAPRIIRADPEGYLVA